MSWTGCMAVRAGLALIAVLLLSPEAGAWRRSFFDDVTVVERSEIIVVGRLVPESIVKVDHPPLGPEYGSLHHHTATLIVSEVLRGTVDGAELPIAIQYGLTPVEGRWPSADEEPGRIDIRDTGNSAYLLEPRVAHAERDNLWFLRREDGEVGRPPTPTGLLSIIDPEDVQPLAKLDYFRCYLADNPMAAFQQYVATHTESADAAKSYLDRLAMRQILAIDDPRERSEASAFGAGLEWEVQALAPGGRIDAVADLGEGVVLAASRNPKPGHVFRSADGGKTWTDSGNLLGDDSITSSISCLASAGGGVAYFLTGGGQVWKSEDWGATWSSLGQVSRNPRHHHFLHSYGIAVLPSGTVLVSDTNPSGGHVFRSENGGKDWEDIGAVSPMALYRFELLPDGVLINGWAGHVYKSVDDGRTWTDIGRLAESALYATTYVENGVALQGAEDGRLYRSTDHGETWVESARFDEAADDFAYLGGGIVLYSTYTGALNLYVSRDHGMTWENIGPVPTGVPEDVLDHFVPVTFEGKTYVVGGSKKGYMVRMSVSAAAE